MSGVLSGCAGRPVFPEAASGFPTWWPVPQLPGGLVSPLTGWTKCRPCRIPSLFTLPRALLSAQHLGILAVWARPGLSCLRDAARAASSGAGWVAQLAWCVAPPVSACHLVSALQLGGVGGHSPGSTDPKGQGWVPPNLPVAQTRQEAARGLPEASPLGGASQGPSSEAAATLCVWLLWAPFQPPSPAWLACAPPAPQQLPQPSPSLRPHSPFVPIWNHPAPAFYGHLSGQVGGLLRLRPSLSATPGVCAPGLGWEATGVSPWDLLLRLAACSVGPLLQAGR